MFILENTKLYLLGTHCRSIFVECIQEKGASLFANCNKVCYVLQSCQC